MSEKLDKIIEELKEEIKETEYFVELYDGNIKRNEEYKKKYLTQLYETEEILNKLEGFKWILVNAIY